MRGQRPNQALQQTGAACRFFGGLCSAAPAAELGRSDDRVEDYDFGRFGWATDPEGNRFELWKPHPPGQG